MTRVAGVVLAAGASRRLGGSEIKQLLTDSDGTTLVARAAGRLRDAGCEPVVVVTGAHHESVAEAVTGLQVEVVHNDQWSEGMSTSIACAVRLLTESADYGDVGSVLLSTSDMPGIVTMHFKAIIDAFERHNTRISSSFGEIDAAKVRGVPALFPRGDWPALCALSGDRGARQLLSDEYPSVYSRSGGADLDTPADVAAWRHQEP